MSDREAVPRRSVLAAAGLAVAGGVAAAGSAASAARRTEAVRTSLPGPDGMYAAKVRDVMWAYRDRGSGPPALFLHSFLLNSNLWTDQLHGLGDIRRCIAPDMRGWGRSEAVTDTYLDPIAYADDVVRFLDALNVTEPVDLVGMSVGAFIGGLVYERIPERIASLTLVSGTFSWEKSLPYERYQAEMARIVVVEGKDTLFRRFDEYIDGSASSLHQRARYHQMLLDSRTEMIVAFLTETGRTQPRPDLPAKIRIPVLLPIGSDDTVITPAQADAMARVFPDAEVIRIEGAGRLLSVENPAEFNNALRSFWTGRARR